MNSHLPIHPLAGKAHGYLVEPILTEPNCRWEGHHATNSCCIRFSCDPRVFLGYRAGGSDDRYCIWEHEVWASHLGLAVLDARGERVISRLPLPTITIERDRALPQNLAEFEAWQATVSPNPILILHDFRFWEDDGFLYVIYHEGTLTQVFDCIVRMEIDVFLERVRRSVEISVRPLDAIRDEWRALWWQAGVWEPCGVNGTNRIYPAATTKNDIVFIRLRNGSLRMLHRPAPDVAIVDTGGNTHCPATPDGFADMGTLQRCIRPGLFDNSHVGNNGTPTHARVGEVDVYLDVTHGVNNRQISEENVREWHMLYLPFLRLLDFDTGEELYYSEHPILEADETWREYVEQGAWVSKSAHLDGVMFAGGHVEAERGCNGLDNLFHFYTGVGDTAVARASFRLRDMLPESVVTDIAVRAAHRAHVLPSGDRTEFALPEQPCGWTWRIVGDPAARDIHILRSLDGMESLRPVGARPGYFDADGLFYGGVTVRLVDGLGWIVLYRGVRWDEDHGRRTTTSAFGLLALDAENPERIWYRSFGPLEGRTHTEDGWTAGVDPYDPAEMLDRAVELIPAQVRDEIRRIVERRPMPSDMTMWLRQRSDAQRR